MTALDEICTEVRICIALLIWFEFIHGLEILW